MGRRGGEDKMATVRRRHSNEFKAQVALEALKGQKTLNELASEFGVHPVQIAQWKRQAQEGLSGVFASPGSSDRQGKTDQALIDQLYQQIGQLNVELDWLRKKGAVLAEELNGQQRDVNAVRAFVEPTHPHLSIARQCELLGVARSSWYYTPAGESDENLALMRLLDEQYTRTPFYGVRRMTAWLHRQGYAVNHKRVGRLLRQMGLEAVYPKPRLSAPGTGTPTVRYPYLLRGLSIARVNQVWSTEIVCTQMTKTDLFAVWLRWEDVADLDLVVRNDHAVNEQLDQLPTLLEGGAG